MDGTGSFNGMHLLVLGGTPLAAMVARCQSATDAMDCSLLDSLCERVGEDLAVEAWLLLSLVGALTVRLMGNSRWATRTGDIILRGG